MGDVGIRHGRKLKAAVVGQNKSQDIIICEGIYMYKLYIYIAYGRLM